DYEINGSNAVVHFAGDLTEGDLDFLYNAAKRHNLDTTKLHIKVNAVGARADDLLKGLYARSDEAIAARDARIKELENQLSQTKGKAIPYGQITKELKYKYPSVSSLAISRGSRVVMQADSVSEVPVTNAIIQSSEPLSAEQMQEITNWLRLRLDDTTIVANNITE
ncbi:MAG: hypothetical protein II963_03670, partial [Bacteroidales bacterium]|nr:hypothetical protein [Bacteroidales bacterium]